MAVDITFDDVTNATTLLDGTGYFDRIMKVATLHIEEQFNSNKITGEAYANVYLGGLQSALSTAQQFVLAEKMQEAQIEGIAQDNLVKEQQVLIAQQELLLKTKQLELEAYKLANMMPAELAQLTDATHGQEWARQLAALKLQLDAEVTLYGAKRLDSLPSIINGDESATTDYAALITAIPTV